MSIKAMVWYLDNSPLTGNDKLAMVILADYANDEGECFPGHKRVAQRLNMTVSGARKILYKLRDAGELQIDNGDGIKTKMGQFTNRYHLLAYQKAVSQPGQCPNQDSKECPNQDSALGKGVSQASDTDPSVILNRQKKPSEEIIGSQPVESPPTAKRPQQSLSSKAKSEYMPGLPMPKHKRQRADAANNAADVKARLPLVEKLIDIWAVRGLTDDPDYDGAELGECHKVAEKLLRDGETAASLDVHYKAYLADEWRNTPVSPSAFARFIAQAKQGIRTANGIHETPTFKQWCLKRYHCDKPHIALGLNESELRREYEQSIRTH